jgi:CheY-like chemotaxis protein
MSTILVVDDDPTCRELLRRILARAGHAVVVASNGKDALAALGEHSPQLILLDLAMPQMDGLTFLRRLREMPQYVQTPVILCTALANRDIVRIAASLGVKDYLLKSEYTMQVLLERIARYLPSRTSSPADTATPAYPLPSTPAA